jgi:hypothetical protein
MEEPTEQMFGKTEALRRVRQVIKTEWPKTLGYRIEVQTLDGHIYSLRNGLEPAQRTHNAEFRIMKSTCGEWAELRDMFRMNIGTTDQPAHAVK